MVGTILVVITGISMIAALYLNVAARTTLVGREIQSLEWKTGKIREENANLKTELAQLLSYREVASRSDRLDFRAATATETHNLLVPGYQGKGPVNLVDGNANNTEQNIISEAYTQSLFDWFGQQMQGGLR